AALGERLRAAVPATVTLGRLDGDEFAVVARDADGAAGLAAAHAAVRAMEASFRVANQTVQAGGTIRLGRPPPAGETREELMRRADLARRSLKGGGHGRVAGFAREMEEEFGERLFIKRELRRALAEQALEVHYQPIVAAEGQRIVGVEALARWTHPS